MRRYWIILVAFLMLVLAGCQQATTEQSEATPTEASPTIMPTEEVVSQVDYCLSCHTDKEQLISTAKPEEPVEAESKGVG